MSLKVTNNRKRKHDILQSTPDNVKDASNPVVQSKLQKVDDEAVQEIVSLY